MRHIALLLLLATASAALVAQNPPPGEPQIEMLRGQIRERWHSRVRQQLELTDAQAAKLQATEDRFFERRRGVLMRQRQVVAGLRAQLQPGVAANADSVRVLMDERDRNRAALLDLDREESHEMAGYLTAVQLARYQVMRQRLQERILEMRRMRRQMREP
jgi:Spy/CpxP family protein refolding chaperone